MFGWLKRLVGGDQPPTHSDGRYADDYRAQEDEGRRTIEPKLPNPVTVARPRRPRGRVEE